LADQGAKVCLIDADDEGPSLHFYMSVDPNSQSKLWFFSDWFCTQRPDLPDGLVQSIPGYSNLSIIAGSLHPTDLEKLDKLQRGKRPQSGNFTAVQGRMKQLICELTGSKHKFTHIIIDTAPGLAHLSSEIVMNTIALGGKLAFVVQPRVADILSFCLDWGVMRKGKEAMVIINKHSWKGSYEESNFLEHLKIFTSMPQFMAYARRLGKGQLEQLPTHVSDVYQEFHKESRIFPVPFEKELMHAADIRETKNNVLEAVIQCTSLMRAAENICKRLNLIPDQRGG
jgi:MinD-like ATPase involved in chromosome partitioning or flagellar assembly